MVEVIVAHQRTERFPAELAVLRLVDLLEDRALIPRSALVAAQRLVEVGLADVHHADLELLIGLGVVDQVMQSAPGAFQLLEVGLVHDFVDLVGELLVDLGDDRLDRGDHIVADELGIAQGLRRERLDRGLDRVLGLVGLGLELFVQQLGEIVVFERALRGLKLGFSHVGTPDACVLIDR